ncbi:MAG: ABC transporter substrate-binding protein [Gemmatimonadales bacterium]|nr:ABC transporter substrate-binding protein [Gemmatimonadales bacterium]
MLGAATLALFPAACGPPPGEGPVITFPGSSLGSEAQLVERQIARFTREHPGVRVVFQRTPDDATQRHQLYVQRLNARSDDPDVLQLDPIWTAEFAAAGWLLPLERFDPPLGSHFSATAAASVWQGIPYALPWFVDVGMLYWRTDLLPAAPATLEELVTLARQGMRGPRGPPRGLVWQGARYEGLVTVFQEYLGAFGGEILTDDGRVAVDSPAGVRALEFMRDQIHRYGIAPEAVLTWHEEEGRFAFQNGTAVLMRNWQYPYGLMNGPGSRVAGRFGVAPMPAAPGGKPTAALGGSQLAVNANSDVPDAAYELIAYLTAPEQMLERAEAVGQFPTRAALYTDPRLAAAIPVPLDEARRIIEAAEPRPVTPIYTQLSEILQIHLHRALTRQRTPAAALREAQAEMQQLLNRSGLGATGSRAAR